MTGMHFEDDELLFGVESLSVLLLTALVEIPSSLDSSFSFLNLCLSLANASPDSPRPFQSV